MTAPEAADDQLRPQELSSERARAQHGARVAILERVTRLAPEASARDLEHLAAAYLAASR